MNAELSINYPDRGQGSFIIRITLKTQTKTLLKAIGLSTRNNFKKARNEFLHSQNPE